MDNSVLSWRCFLVYSDCFVYVFSIRDRMDDAYRSGKGLYISSESFTFSEHQFLVNLLQTKFGLDCGIHVHTNGYRIYIFSTSVDKLISLVKPYFIEQFYYKLGL